MYRFLSRRKMGTVSVRPSSLPPLPRALIIYAIALRPPGTHLTPVPHDLVILPRARDQTDQCCNQDANYKQYNKPDHHSSPSLGCWSHERIVCFVSGYWLSTPWCLATASNLHDISSHANSSSLMERIRSALVCLRFRSYNTSQRYAALSCTVSKLGHLLAELSAIYLPSTRALQALSSMQSAQVFAGCFWFLAIIILLSAVPGAASTKECQAPS